MHLTKQQLKYVAQTCGPMLSWPTHISVLADELESHDLLQQHNRKGFIDAATEAWENARPPEEIDDEINY